MACLCAAPTTLRHAGRAVKAPEGMQFEMRADDPALRQFKEMAHRRGLDQEAFSETLGIYFPTKIAELAEVNAARQREMGKLGAAGPQRLYALETWFKAKIGDKSNILISTLKEYPIASTVEALESVVRLFSSQGGGSFSQSHRAAEEDTGKIPGYDQMSFAQKRAAQMSQKFGR